MKRLDKLIALNCNVSRRDARQLIKDGEVTVNGVPALRAEELVNEESDVISVKGKTFTSKDHIYLMMNKPEGVVSATDDKTHKTAVDLIPDELSRKSLFLCGRLDKDTTGLLIITDDGAFCHEIMSPNHKVYKTYIATLAYPLDNEAISELESGVELSDGTKCLPAKVKYFTDNGEYKCELKIREGKYHQVKRMLYAVGNRVDALERVAIGGLELDRALPAGSCRELTEDEKAAIFAENEG